MLPIHLGAFYILAQLFPPSEKVAIFIHYFFFFMANSQKRSRLAIDAPEVREYTISSIDHMTGSMEGVSKLKYIKKVPTGETRRGQDGKEYKVFEDRVFEQWIDNPGQVNYTGFKLKFTTEIVD